MYNIYILIFICRRPSSNMYAMKCYVFCWVWEIYNELDNSSHLQILHSIILYGFLRCEKPGYLGAMTQRKLGSMNLQSFQT